MATAFNQGHSLKRRIEMIVREKTCRSLSWKMRTALLVTAVTVSPVSFFGSGTARSNEEAPSQSRRDGLACLFGRFEDAGGDDYASGARIGTRRPAFRREPKSTFKPRTIPTCDAVLRPVPRRKKTERSGSPWPGPNPVLLWGLWADQSDRSAPVIAVAEGYGPDWGNGLEKDGVTLTSWLRAACRLKDESSTTRAGPSRTPK